MVFLLPSQQRYIQLTIHRLGLSIQRNLKEFTELDTKALRLPGNMVEQEVRKYELSQSHQFWHSLWIRAKNTSIFVNQNIGRFKIAMDNSFHVAIGNSWQHLVQKFLYFLGLHLLASQTFEVIFQVLVQILEYQVKLFLVDNDIFQPTSLNFVRDDIFVFNLSQQGYFSDGGAWESLVLDFNKNFFDGNIFIVLEIEGFVDETVSSLSLIDRDIPMLSYFL